MLGLASSPGCWVALEAALWATLTAVGPGPCPVQLAPWGYSSYLAMPLPIARGVSWLLCPGGVAPCLLSLQLLCLPDDPLCLMAGWVHHLNTLWGTVEWPCVGPQVTLTPGRQGSWVRARDPGSQEHFTLPGLPSP